MARRTQINVEKVTEALAQGKLPSFGQLFEEIQPGWDMVHSDLVGQEIVICSAQPCETQFGSAYICECLVDGEMCNVLMGGQVLCKQLEKLLNRLPFTATIVHEHRYYEFQQG